MTSPLSSPRPTLADRPQTCTQDWERALVEGLVARRADAWRIFQRQYGALVQHMTVRAFLAHGASIHEVEDAVSLFHERLLVNDARRLRAFDPTVARLSTWIGNIARQSAVQYIRDHKRDRVRPRLPVESVADPEAEAARAENRDRINQALAQLSSTDRDLLVASYLDDVSLPELAARFSLSEKTVYSKRCRLRARLSSLLPAAA